jgi:hypothetical protein
LSSRVQWLRWRYGSEGWAVQLAQTLKTITELEVELEITRAAVAIFDGE